MFRQRQKAYLQQLETKVQQLSTENEQCKANLELFRSENKLIKEQLAFLRSFISQAMATQTPGANVQNL